jgi:hypothetical protein
MRALVTHALALALICAVVVIVLDDARSAVAEPAPVAARVPASGSSGESAAPGEEAALKADKEFLAALNKLDKNAAGKLLDDDFAWTNIDGKTRNRAVSLDEIAALAADHEGDTEVQTHFYGQLATVMGVHHKAHFARIWVKRPGGWREFISIDTPIPDHPPAQTTIEAAAGEGDCENPCRTVPYNATTAMDKSLLADWQKTKMEEWHPSADWPNHIADEFLIVNNASARNKAQRVAINQDQVKSGVGTPGDPVTSMKIYDFGPDAAVMISQHRPYRGGKPYYNVRVWTFREQRWQLALSQQTSIQAEPAREPLQSKSVSQK